MSRHHEYSGQKVAGDTNDERANSLGSWRAIGLLCWRIVGKLEKAPGTEAPGKSGSGYTQSRLISEPADASHEINRGTARHGIRPSADGIGVATDPMGEGRPPAARIGGDELRCITEPSEL